MIPALARRARLRWDDARGSDVLLYPEGVLLLTPEAAEILHLVDGSTTVDDIVRALCEAHPEAPPDAIDRDVRELLQRLRTRGFIAMEAAP